MVSRHQSTRLGMKKLLTLVMFLLLLSSFVVAQGNGGGNGNNGNGQGNGPWSNTNLPQFITTWLQNGGQIPQPVAVAVIREARSWGQQTCGLNQGQMIQKYFQGLLTVEFVSTSPPSMTFRVSFGGNVIFIILEDL
jgi:hypothetical protein